ncbi:MAG TPA: hypothetical protein VMM81_04000 [Acidimicrobiia bacterium]|nr:hypothetical protein [Acidimicrobiia bacterium]
MLAIRLAIGASSGLLVAGVSRAGEITDQVRANPELQRLLIGVGIVTAAIFVLGILKHAVRAAVIGGILCVAVWLWYFNLR